MYSGLFSAERQQQNKQKLKQKQVALSISKFFKGTLQLDVCFFK